MSQVAMSRSVALLVLCAGSPLSALAIDTPPVVPPQVASPAPVNSARNYVGKGQSENTPAGVAMCTETHLGNGLVLTAGHCVYTDQDSVSYRRYESVARFELGANRYMAMSQTSQKYAGLVGAGATDVAIRYIINGQTANAAPANILSIPAFDNAIIGVINPNPVNGVPPADVPFTVVGWKSSDEVTSPNLLEGLYRPRLGVPDATSPAGAIGAGYTATSWIYNVAPGAGNNRSNKGDSGGPTFASFGGQERLVGIHSFSDRVVGGQFTRDYDARVSPNVNFILGRGEATPNGQVGVWNRYTAGAGVGGWNAANNWTRQDNPTTNTLPQDNDFVILDPTANPDAGGYTVQLSFASSRAIMGLANDVRLEISGGVEMNVAGQSGVVNSGVITTDGLASVLTVAANIDNAGRIVASNRSVVRVANVAGSMPAVNQYAMPAEPAAGLPAYVREAETKSIFNDVAGQILIDSGSAIVANSLVENRGSILLRGGSTGRIGFGLPATTTSRDDSGAAPVLTLVSSLSLAEAAGSRLDIESGSSLDVATLLLNRGAIRVSGGAAARSVLAIGANVAQQVGTLPGLGLPPRAFANLSELGDPAGSGQTVVDAGGDIIVTNGAANRTALAENGLRGVITVRGNATTTGTFTSDFGDNRGQVIVQGGGRFTVLNSYFNSPNGVTRVSGDAAAGDGRFEGSILNFPGIPAAGATPARAPGSFEVGARGRVFARPPANLPDSPALENRDGALVTIGSRGVLNVAGDTLNRGSIVLTRDALGYGLYNGTPAPGAAAGVSGTTRNFGLIRFDGVGLSFPLFGMSNHSLRNQPGSTLMGNGAFIIDGLSDWSTATVGGDSNYNLLELTWDAAGNPNAFARMEAPSGDRGTNGNVLRLQYAFYKLCFMNSSRVQVVDNFANDGGGAEALYTRYLGNTGNSVIDLNGHNLYYDSIDPDCGFDATSFINGRVIQIPASGVVMVLAMAGMVASRRRRS